MLSLAALLMLADGTKVVLDSPLVQGVFYAPAGKAVKLPTVLVLHGSEGSVQFTDFTAKNLAAEGYPALAVRYFGGKDQPKNLVEVPVESLDRAMEWLADRPEVDPNRIIVMGFSRGAELALTYASFNQKVKGVVAIAPTSMRFQGFIDMMTPTQKAAFTYRGKPLPFTTVEFDGRPVGEVYKPYLAAKADAPEWIAAEKINGPVLLFSGQKDVVWPSSLLTSKLVSRLKEKRFKHPVEWHDYPDAGHVFMVKLPPGAESKFASTQFGGTKEGVFKAMQDAWPRLVEFMKGKFPTAK